jgi:hypothetical protein
MTTVAPRLPVRLTFRYMPLVGGVLMGSTVRTAAARRAAGGVLRFAVGAGPGLAL